MIHSAHKLLPHDQKHNYNCGPTVIHIACGILGLPISQEEAQGACGTGVNGTGEKDLLKGLRALGFEPIVKESKTKDPRVDRALLDWVRAETDLGSLVAATINGHADNGHWILIIRVLDRGVQIWDPNNQLSKVVKASNLFKAWWNIDPGDDTNSGIWTVALRGRSRATRRAIRIRANLLSPPAGKLPTTK